ncbi:hypothetical protein FBALC1_02582 [Flavobacteriales bacterium ALC-1]|nr:hypothetical protein FBALC1_02582 [Flavobacteriales bacterium ALC-1]
MIALSHYTTKTNIIKGALIYSAGDTIAAYTWRVSGIAYWDDACRSYVLRF